MDFVTDAAKLIAELLGGFCVSTCGSTVHHRIDHVIYRRREVMATEQFLGSSCNRVITR
jgi:hypothetical protein